MVRIRRKKAFLVCLAMCLTLAFIGWMFHQADSNLSSPVQDLWHGRVQQVRAAKRQQWCSSHKNRSVLIRDDWDFRLFPRPRLLPNFKNPCYLEGSIDNPLGKQVRCLPYFLVAGFPKAGTTDLWFRLINHQSIALRHVKEPMFFNRGRYAKSFFKAASQYTEFYDNAARMIQKLVSPASCQGTFPYHYAITGEASVDTAFDIGPWQQLPGNNGCREPVITNADYVYHINPNIKVIFMLRNPVERLYSDYIYEARFLGYKTTQADFHKTVLETIQNFTDCVKTSSVRGCVYNSSVETTKVRLRVGLYHVFVSDWLDVFPAHNVLVLRSEDTLGTRKLDVYKQICRFLDIRPFTIQEEVSVFRRGSVNTRSKPEIDLGDMWPQTRSVLEEFYKPFNQQLKQLIPSIDYNVKEKKMQKNKTS